MSVRTGRELAPGTAFICPGCGNEDPGVYVRSGDSIDEGDIVTFGCGRFGIVLADGLRVATDDEVKAFEKRKPELCW